MSARELIAPHTIRHMTGFGGAQGSEGYVFQPSSLEGVREVLALARRVGRPVVLRGAGRSYGDPALLPEGVVLDLSQLNGIPKWDAETGVIQAEAGATIGDVWKRCLTDGWWPPVVPGTMFPTLGGALAMNIHGKNGVRAGTLGEHVLSLDVMHVDSGEVETLEPDHEHFGAVVSGAGLAGIIVGVHLQMKRVPSGDVEVRAKSCHSWAEQFDAFARHEDAEYRVSWVDCFATGPARGRGLFHGASHAEGPSATLLEAHQALPSKVLGIVPKSETWRALKLLNHRAGMRLVNAAKYAAGRHIEHGKTTRQSLVAFSFLLDYVPGWERAYSPGGFVQVQTFVPAAEARRVFDDQVQMMQAEGHESFLAVLKQHRSDGFALSHGVDGFSLALDLKVTEANHAHVWGLAGRMQALVLAAGGRFYLAKDSTLTPEQFQSSIGPDGLARHRAARAHFDPEGLLTTAQGMRLGLT